jgi:phosphohistidine swiveling domain-containing protein
MQGDVGHTIATAVREAAAARNGLAVAAALNCIEPGELAEFFHASLAAGVDAEPIGEGLPASPGAASGTIALTADDALRAAEDGQHVILVRPETTPDDVLGMQASQGILTSRGGMVSHAAVVARGWGIPAVVGAACVHLAGDSVTIGDVVLHAGDEITIDGSSGKIYAGRLATSGSEPPPELETLLAWADTVARGHVQVRVNADTEADASYGRELGAQGIGLCRTEHMFLAGDRLPIMRRFILSHDPATEEAALAELAEAQTADFESVLEAMDDLPVTIRLLDPPLHEFLPDLVDLTAREARGELTAEECTELAAHADFFSFGTNDLTQMTYAFSRDDVEAKLLPAYQALGVLPANPFAVLDQEGVGELVRIGCEVARAAKPEIKLGVCGEHAGHPESAGFLVRLGVDSVSCSPFRVPLARLGVAQALLASGRVNINDVEFDFDIAPAADEAVAGAGPAASGPSSNGAAAGGAEPGDGDVVVDLEVDVEVGFEVDEALVLHILRIRGFVTVEGLTASVGRPCPEILEALVAAGHVRHIEKRNMYGLLPAGTERHEAMLVEAVPREVRDGLREPYERFLQLNEEFKQLCTDWQMRDGQPNDHNDAEYDRTCVERLLELSAAAAPIIDAMAATLPRLRRYGVRLARAAECVVNGETNRFTGVMCDSFHDIWMELHEDLIVLQRIDRVAEGSF